MQWRLILRIEDALPGSGAEKFYISVRNYKGGKGTVDVIASGLMSGPTAELCASFIDRSPGKPSLEGLVEAHK